MDCIKYINDLKVEISMLRELKENRIEDNQDCSEFDEKIQKKENLISRCKENLRNLSDNQICYRIYLAILDGLSPSKAIDKIASENYIKGIKPMDTSTLWENYYKKVKKIINSE